MKKIIISIIAAFGIFGTYSCSDMLETDSTRQVFNPELNQKTDSVNYAMGIMKGMQALADQYFYQGEMRGELLTTTDYTDNNLRQLANFSVEATNKYDSAYVYYNVINNCNYFLSKRDTAELYVGDHNVTINEYASIAAVRAWAYMQLGRTYKKVPFFLEPITEISKVENNNFPELDLNGIVAALAPTLEDLAKRYTEDYLQVPNYSKGGTSDLSMGVTNFGAQKYVNPAHLFIPLRIALAEMYLETGQYEKAAENYFKYINFNTANQLKSLSDYPAFNTKISIFDMPTDYRETAITNYYKSYRSEAEPSKWGNIFGGGANPVDVVSYIPMAVNKLNGTTSTIPETFGYDYYATGSNTLKTIRELQVLPSEEYYSLADTALYYYRSVAANGQERDVYKNFKYGDGRLDVLKKGEGNDSTLTWIQKARNATVYLYRTSTIYLHLAEALNRMGYPDAAFCILKDGISDNAVNLLDTITTKTNCYISVPTYEMLCTKIPFLSEENIAKYPYKASCGIHQHGSGLTIGVHTEYQMPAAIGAKLDELNKKFSLNITNPTKQDTINAMEDLLCDEYALELAFEGSRFFDLCRLARHKNSAGRYSANFGTLWLSEKYRKRGLDGLLMNEDNWYLPFK